jgi:hypothetical protein
MGVWRGGGRRSWPGPGALRDASWLRGGQRGDDFQGSYYFLGSLGRNGNSLATVLLRRAVEIIVPGERVRAAPDDTPTRRSGRPVEGAGIHHNPTPGPADQKFLFGQVGGTVAWVVRPSCWGTIGLPLVALLYVRHKDIPKIVPWSTVTFRTKLDQGAELVAWAAGVLHAAAAVARSR